jgi:hypothetical protein
MLLVEIENLDLSNDQRMVLLQSFKKFILLNYKRITGRIDPYNENNWTTMEGDEPLHLALKNILLDFSRIQKEMVNIVLVHLAALFVSGCRYSLFNF